MYKVRGSHKKLRIKTSLNVFVKVKILYNLNGDKRERGRDRENTRTKE